MVVDLELLEAVQTAVQRANVLQHELVEMLDSEWFHLTHNESTPPQKPGDPGK